MQQIKVGECGLQREPVTFLCVARNRGDSRMAYDNLDRAIDKEIGARNRGAVRHRENKIAWALGGAATIAALAVLLAAIWPDMTQLTNAPSPRTAPSTTGSAPSPMTPR